MKHIAEKVQNNFILLFLTLSIFFSHVKIDFKNDAGVIIYFFEFRFLILLILPILLLDIIKKKNLVSFRQLLILITISLLIFFHSLFGKYLLDENYNNFSINFIDLKLILQILVLFFSALILINYRKIIESNIFNILKLVIILFFLSMVYYFIFGDLSVWKLAKLCNKGFFYQTQFLFNENSHFALIATPILIFFSLNYERLINEKFVFFIFIFFVFFCLIFISLTLYFSLLSCALILLIFFKRFRIKGIIFLFSILTIFTYVFFSGDTRCEFVKKGVFKKDPLDLQYKDVYPEEQYRLHWPGRIYSPKGKLFNIFNFEDRYDFIYSGKPNENYGPNILMNLIQDTEKNLSFRIYFNSLHLSLVSLREFPLGYGLNNYSKSREKAALSRSANIANYSTDPLNLKCTIKCLDGFNREDGSNNFNKLLNEFGIFFIFFTLIIIFKLFIKNIGNDQLILLLGIIVPQILIRGSGYFFNGFYLAIILLLISIFLKKNEENTIK